MYLFQMCVYICFTEWRQISLWSNSADWRRQPWRTLFRITGTSCFMFMDSQNWPVRFLATTESKLSSPLKSVVHKVVFSDRKTILRGKNEKTNKKKTYFKRLIVLWWKKNHKIFNLSIYLFCNYLKGQVMAQQPLGFSWFHFHGDTMN